MLGRWLLSGTVGLGFGLGIAGGSEVKAGPPLSASASSDAPVLLLLRNGRKLAVRDVRFEGPLAVFRGAAGDWNSIRRSEVLELREAAPLAPAGEAGRSGHARAARPAPAARRPSNAGSGRPVVRNLKAASPGRGTFNVLGAGSRPGKTAAASGRAAARREAKTDSAELPFRLRAATIRRRLENARIDARGLESELRELEGSVSLGHGIEDQEERSRRMVKQNARARQVKKRLERATELVRAEETALRDLADEVRRAGIPPGTLR